ncbi:MAG: GNAT family N-acetyltransferase [Bryobacterales bacterium]|nr:GNAT family N-acetyltransferase [Bryobacterales bacterium]
MDALLRLIEPADLPHMMALVEAAGWNQTRRDLERFLELAPDTAFAIECDGKLVATAGAVCYERRLAWIGMVLTLPQYRGRGFARRLMERCLESLRALGIEWAKLDATDMGEPLYASLGFETECTIERWFRPPGAKPALWMPETAGEPRDAGAFGADRSRLLAALVPEGWTPLPGGYAMARLGRVAAFFGPMVAPDAATAEQGLAWCLARFGDGPLYWDLLPGNAAAPALAREHGFEPRRTLARMALCLKSGSEPIPCDANRLFAAAGFEYG